MTPETINAGWLMVAAVLIAAGYGLVRVGASAWAERRANRVAVQSVETDTTVEWLRLLDATDPGAPCFEFRTTGAPLICGRNDGHQGHHIAFGAGHRIIATWPRLSLVERDNVIPIQRDGGAA